MYVFIYCFKLDVGISSFKEANFLIVLITVMITFYKYLVYRYCGY